MSHHKLIEEPQYTLKFNRYSVTPEGWITGSLRLEQGDHNLGWWTTRERGHNRVSLRQGDYIMEHSIKHTKRHVKCLRPIEGSISSILVHDAYNDDPNELEGCIAPGFADDVNSWYDSAGAMVQLFKLMGGWRKHALVKLVVLSNAPGVTGTKDTWARIHPVGKSA